MPEPPAAKNRASCTQAYSRQQQRRAGFNIPVTAPTQSTYRSLPRKTRKEPPEIPHPLPLIRASPLSTPTRFPDKTPHKQGGQAFLLPNTRPHMSCDQHAQTPTGGTTAATRHSRHAVARQGARSGRTAWRACGVLVVRLGGFGVPDGYGLVTRCCWRRYGLWVSWASRGVAAIGGQCLLATEKNGHGAALHKLQSTSITIFRGERRRVHGMQIISFIIPSIDPKPFYAMCNYP